MGNMAFRVLKIIEGVFYLGQVVGGDAGVEYCGGDAGSIMHINFD